MRFWALGILAFAALLSALLTADPREPRIRVLMLGDDGHHRPLELSKVLALHLTAAGMDFRYTDRVQDLTDAILGATDVLVLYLNTPELPAANEAALLRFVEGGGGLAALHCASACFGNSERYTELLGGRFGSHGEGKFRARIVDAQHPVTAGLTSFESWDETYRHVQLADDLQVLMVRFDDGRFEPWTWVRRQGKGRVFYTASGHDYRTWSETGFQSLVRRGVEWAAGRAKETAPPIEYEDVKLPTSVVQGGATVRIAKPLTPEDSVRHMHLPEGFSVRCFASEPRVVKPIAMAFDDRGRLWVAESTDYPDRIAPAGAPGGDRIQILEDTDLDGRADKFTVFAEGLNLAQGIAVVEGGCVVAAAPDILRLSDLDGDGKCDERKVLYTGFARWDTHATHGNFRRGLDGWIYATCGYSGLDVTVNGVRHRSGACVFRFKDDGGGFEVLTPTSNNTWGVGFDAEGELFASTANGSHCVFVGVPNRYIEAVEGFHAVGNATIENHVKAHPVTSDVRQVDFHGGYTAASDLTIYTGRNYPPEFWGNALVCEPTMHLIHRDLVKPRGAGYVADDGYNLMASSDPWTAPIQTCVGPEGDVWFLDWYSPVVQHNPTPAGYKTLPGNAFDTPLRDRGRGRIYRISYMGLTKGAPERAERVAAAASLESGDVSVVKEALGALPRGAASVKAILAAACLSHPDLGIRRHALLTLADMPPTDAAGEAVAALMQSEAGSDPWIALAAIPAAARHARGFLAKVLTTSDEEAASRRVGEFVNGGFEDYLRMSNAEWTPVRYSGTASFNRDQGRKGFAARIESREGADAGWRLTVNVEPRTRYRLSGWIRTEGVEAGTGLGALLNVHEFQSPRVKTAAVTGTKDWTLVEVEFDSGDHARLSFHALLGGWGHSKGVASYDDVKLERLGATGGLEGVVRAVAAHAAARQDDAALIEALTALPRAPLELQRSFLQGLTAGARAHRSPAVRQAWSAAARSLGPGLVADVARASAALGVSSAELEAASAEARAAARARFRDKGLTEAARLEAAATLVALDRDGAGCLFLTEDLGTGTDAWNAGLVRLLRGGADVKIAEAVVARSVALRAEAKREAIELLLAREAFAAVLVKALEEESIRLEELDMDQRARLGKQRDPELAKRVASLLATAAGAEKERAALVASKLALASKRGNRDRGRDVFRANCLVCHAVNGDGGKVGPELAGIHGGDRVQILTHILDPNRSVEGNYRRFLVWTKSGETYAGRLVAETQTSLEILDSAGGARTFSRADLDETRVEPFSLMPEGFELLPDADLVDLVEYLAATRKPAGR